MRKAVLASVALAVMSVPLPNLSAFAQNGGPDRPVGQQQQSQPNGEADIPVKQVVLFSSGVGYFEHFGTVEGAQQADLQFKTEQINDILKSLVLQDLDGGSVSTITYPSQDPLEKQLRSFQVDIASNPTLADLLNQLRGARVTIRQVDRETIGTILGVEKKPRPVGNGDDEKVIEVSVLNLIEEGGRLVSIPLDDVQSVELADPQLQEELARALAAVAQARDQDKKPVLINFSGQGERRVRLGYVVETPIWKTSYRLVLPTEAEGATPKLQGWAIVENQTDNDWNDVQLSLVSGRPISFVMNLYQPLYVPRPTVEPELFASLRPQTYGAGWHEQESLEAVGDREESARQMGQQLRRARGGLQMQEKSMLAEEMRELSLGVDAAGRPMGGAAGAPAAPALEPFNYTSSVASVASASEIGELFQYTVGNVSLPRQKSAMIPIITDDVEVEPLSIYNRTVLAKHPLTGARVKNTTGKHLLQGPVTVFDDNAYAGDAQINNVPPGQERLISYGVDLNVVANADKNTSDQSLLTGKIVKGVLHLSRRHVFSQEYVLDNKADKDKTVIVEHPYRKGWTLEKTDKPIETTDTVYRFRVAVPKGQKQTFTVTEQVVQGEAIAILPADIGQLIAYARAGQIPDDVRKALATAIEMKQRMVDTERKINERNTELNEITQEQNRIRDNLKSVPGNSQYYNRLMTKLNDQETRIETLQKEVDELTVTLDQQRKELETYLGNLTIG